MGTSKTNISKINKYVKGRLSAHDMHRLERETYDDAFLNEAMEGYEELPADDHEETLADLTTQLYRRAAKKKKDSLIIWRVLPIAASVLVLLGAGYWFLTSDPAKNQNIQTKPKDSKSQITLSKNAAPKTTPTGRKFTADASIEPKNIEAPEPVLRQITIEGAPSIKYKTDTVEYIASDYKVRENASVDEMLKKAGGGFEIDTSGSITFNGQSVTKVRLNGKDYMGGDVAKAVQTLPADIIEKFQIVDDYGDRAGRTGIKSGDADKVLNFTTRKQVPMDTVDKPLLNNIVNLLNTPKLIFKTDTIVYRAIDYRVRQNEPIEAILKKAEGFEVERDGNITSQGQPVKRLQINGKALGLVDVKNITRNLPADVVDNFEMIDDYSNVKISFKTPESEKVLNFNISALGNTLRRDEKGILKEASKITNIPSPEIGWKAYQIYLDKYAVVGGFDGVVVLGFLIAPNGKVSEMKVLIGAGRTLNKKAVSLVKNGSKWRGVSTPQEVRVTIVFRKGK